MNEYIVERKCESSKKYDFKFTTPEFDAAEKMFWTAVSSSKGIIGDYTISLIMGSLDTEHEMYIFKKDLRCLTT